MGEAHISTAICHVILAGSSAWTCRSLYEAGNVQWAYGTLGLYIVKSCVGVIRYGSRRGDKVSKIYNFLDLCNTALDVALVTADLYTLLGYSQPLIYAHIIPGFLPIVGLIFQNRNVIYDYIYLILVANLISLITVGLVNKNYWAVASGLSYGYSEFFIRHQGTIQSVPSLDLFLIGLCFFNYFSYKALTDTSI